MATNAFIGQLMLVPYNFAPRNWALCNGQILSIAQNTALFSLLGTQYGGNGQTTFALPDLRGRIPIGSGQGPGLSSYVVGEVSGTETVTLLQTEMPLHNHAVAGVATPANTSTAGGNVLARSASSVYLTPAPGSLNSPLNPTMLQPAGGSLPHENRAPYLTLNWIIALNGVFPSRN